MLPDQIRIQKPPETGEAQGDETPPLPQNLPVMPLRDTVLFPGIIQPLTVGRPRSLALVQEAAMGDRLFAAMLQNDAAEEEPPFDRVADVGCAVRILKLVRMPDETQSVIIQAVSRIRAEHLTQSEPFYRVDCAPMPDIVREGEELDALIRSARDLMMRVIELSPRIPQEGAAVLASIESPGHLADFIAANLNLSTEQKQELLEEPRVDRRLRAVTRLMQREIQVLELASKIQSQTRGRIEESQREHYLREQLKSIQEELGEKDEKTALVEQLRADMDETGMPDEVRTEADRELRRLEAMPSYAPDFNVIRTYLEYLAELPWQRRTDDRINLTEAERILDHDHYGLEEPKKRILEYLAVRKLRATLRGPILCFVGPPGVGKTSLGQSIARAMGRKFVRMSLGGMRDEAEIRGHRRTYVGAMPGRIILELRKAAVNNPVFMLDEVDKLGADWRGDPTSALLEVLDPEQNSTFTDHYLDVPFDLSSVLFIGTANLLDPIPPALKDRLEVIRLPGYVEEEKLAIAHRYLVPRQRKDHGLKAKQIRFTKTGLRQMIRYYTHEAGVRELERQIAAACRAVARRITQGKTGGVAVKAANVSDLLGPERYLPDVKLRTSTPGVATGLAWTPAGGDILFIEATVMPGTGKLTLTGQLGDVMKESVQAALSYVRSRANQWDIDPATFRKNDLHVHVPAGATPKDGPSAGITVFTALTSLLTGRSVRSDVALTGEITLRGLVLPVGGVKEKVLAAKRAGIHTVILPERNRNDIEDIPKDIRKDMTFHYVHSVEDALPLALSDGRKPRRRSAGTRRRKRRKAR
ncbi:MAG: endopeptidase La [Planctomycetes bacterium]|nr:endopeptidase La [Planctomycetota bacterium]